VPAEILQDSLPASSLQLWRVLGLGVERLLHEDAFAAFDELDLHLPAVGHPVFDRISRHDAGADAQLVAKLASGDPT
jgi:hypothetical protein